MKVILSRKGFDSSNGGIMSPIFEDGTMLSLPIPAKDQNKDSVRYDQLTCKGLGIKKILHDLGYVGSEYCHMDPDLVKERRINVEPEWKPIFGQINQAAKYLNNCCVDEGDLFLFFGNFRHVEYDDNAFRYAKKNSDPEDAYYGSPIQAIWGYLQIEKVITNPAEIKGFTWHPHACDLRIHEKNNTIYTAREYLSFAPNLPGCGVFNYDKKRVLTMQGKNKATWKQHEAYDTNHLYNSNRKNSAKSKGIYYAGIWQELVLKDDEISEKWAKNLFFYND